jgi:hypothetical protein
MHDFSRYPPAWDLGGHGAGSPIGDFRPVTLSYTGIKSPARWLETSGLLNFMIVHVNYNVNIYIPS